MGRPWIVLFAGALTLCALDRLTFAQPASPPEPPPPSLDELWQRSDALEAKVPETLEEWNARVDVNSQLRKRYSTSPEFRALRWKCVDRYWNAAVERLERYPESSQYDVVQSLRSSKSYLSLEPWIERLERSLDVLAAATPKPRKSNDAGRVDHWIRGLLILLASSTTALGERDDWPRILSLHERAAPYLATISALGREKVKPAHWTFQRNRMVALLQLGLKDRALAVGPETWAVARSIEDPDARVRRELIELRSQFLLYFESYPPILEENVDHLSRPDLSPDTRARLLFGCAIAASELPEDRGGGFDRAKAFLDEALTLDCHPLLLADNLGVLSKLLVREARYAEAHDSLDRLDALLEPLESFAREARSLALALRHRARRLAGADRTQLEAARARLSSYWGSLEETWLASPIREHGRGYLMFEATRLVLEELIESRLGTEPTDESRLAALQFINQALSLGTLPRLLGAPSVHVDEWREEVLAPGSGALIYFAGTEHTFLFAVDRTSIAVHPLDSRDALRAPLSELSRAVLTPPAPGTSPDAWRELSRRVGERLVPPKVERKLATWDSVTIIEPGIFEFIPFEYLILSGGEELGQRLAVSRASSLQLEHHLVQRHLGSAPTEPLTLCLAAPTVNPEVATHEGLALLDPEVNWRDALFGDHEEEQLVLLEGDQASLTKLSAFEGDPRLLHVFSHSLTDPTREDRVGLIWAPTENSPNGWVSPREFAEVSLPPYVLLTTCSSGSSAHRSGDPNTNDLPGAALRGGALAVVSAPTAIPVRGTVDQTRMLHAALLEGQSLASALRELRVARAATHPHPYDRSLLVVEGHGHRPVFSPEEIALFKKERAPTLAIVVMVGLALALVYYRSRKSTGV